MIESTNDNGPLSTKERVARAIYESQCNKRDGKFIQWRDKSLPIKFWESYECDAEAAITAMIDE